MPGGELSTRAGQHLDRGCHGSGVRVRLPQPRPLRRLQARHVKGVTRMYVDDMVGVPLVPRIILELNNMVLACCGDYSYRLLLPGTWYVLRITSRSELNLCEVALSGRC